MSHPRDEEVEKLHETVLLLKDTVKELKETSVKREEQVRKALESRINKVAEQEREEINILMIVLVVALSFEVVMFVILLFKL